MERKILSEKDMIYWTKSSIGHKELTEFITQLNDKCKRIHDKHINSKYVIMDPILKKISEMLDSMSKLIDEVELALDKNQRFGNIAFRKWYDMMLTCCEKYLKELVSNESLRMELFTYLTDSFGNRQRIDYGTGHELSFVIFLMGVTKCLLGTKEAGDKLHSLVSRISLQEKEFDLVALFGFIYMPLCRKIQAKYRLEPAGSHGVFSLDDFQFLPFLFGSAQLINHPSIEPSEYPERQVAERYKDDFLFHAAINFTHMMKKGHFAEHSNQLWNISGVEDWSKINRGLMRKYIDEVMDKFPIVQHLKFGQHILLCIGDLMLTNSRLIVDSADKEENPTFIEDEFDAVKQNVKVLRCNYNIIYSTSYEVPTLYFNVYQQDGSPLKIEEICQALFINDNCDLIKKGRIKTNEESRSVSLVDLGSIITQFEHPILCRPFYAIHPCKTNDLMQQVNCSKDDYLLAWISTLGTLINLRLNNKYCEINN